MDKMKVSQKIAELRARNGLTAKELGDKIEKSETTILNYEAGKIDIPLSSLLGIAEPTQAEAALEWGLASFADLRRLVFVRLGALVA